MSLTVIDNHSVDLNMLLSDPGPMLDVGCRGFAFASDLRQTVGHPVYCVDPSPDVETEVQQTYNGYFRPFFLRSALVGIGQGDTQQLAMGSDPEAYHLVTANNPSRLTDKTIDVPAMDIVQLSARFQVKQWALVKLNCEGAEYDILKTWPGPIASQIVVSFHEHIGAHVGHNMDEIIAHLGQWYRTVQHVRDQRYCAGWNFWDSVFTLR